MVNNLHFLYLIGGPLIIMTLQNLGRFVARSSSLLLSLEQRTHLIPCVPWQRTNLNLGISSRHCQVRRRRSCFILPEMSSVTTGGSDRAMEARTSSSWSSLHLIIVMLFSDLTSLIAAFSVAIEPKRSEQRFVIALIA